MANPNGKKGSAFERLIADCLADTLDDDRIDRRVKTGGRDKGDVANVRMSPALSGFATSGKVVVEVKNVKAMALGTWVNEADIERGNDDAAVGVVIHKRRGTADPLDQFCTMTVRDFVTLLRGVRP